MKRWLGRGCWTKQEAFPHLLLVVLPSIDTFVFSHIALFDLEYTDFEGREKEKKEGKNRLVTPTTTRKPEQLSSSPTFQYSNERERAKVEAMALRPKEE